MSKYYSIGCLKEREDLMNSLEHRLKGSDALPFDIIEALSGMAS